MKISIFSRLIVIILAVFFLSVLLSGVLRISTDSVKDLVSNRGFILAVLFSLKTSVIATIFAFVGGVPAGFFLARNKGRFSRILNVVFDIPIVVPPLIVGVLLITFFNLPALKFVYSFIFSTPGAIVAQFFVAVPFTIKSSKTAFELIPPVYERIAMTLGAGSFKSFYDTTFKMAFPGILSGLLLTWLRCLGEFGATLMVGGGIPGKTENIPINIYLQMNTGDFENGITAGIMTVIFVFLFILGINTVLLSKGRLS